MIILLCFHSAQLGVGLSSSSGLTEESLKVCVLLYAVPTALTAYALT